MKNIPIFFTFDNNYVEPAAVAFYSLINSKKEDVFYDMYVLNKDISPDKKELLKNIIKDKANLTFVDYGDFLENEYKGGGFNTGHAQSKFTIETLIKCFAAKFFPQYDKIIYSDVDVIFVDDISEIYNIDLTNKYAAGVKNFNMKHDEFELSHLNQVHYELLKDVYIAGGIWVLNLSKIREDNIEDKMISVIKDETIIKRWNDQDIINIACGGNFEFLPLNYISYPYLFEYMKNTPDFVSHFTKEEIYDSLINPKIIHFAGVKPWISHDINYAKLWLTIFDFLNLDKSYIYNDRSIKTTNPYKKKYKKYKKLFMVVFTIAIVLLFLLIFIILY